MFLLFLACKDAPLDLSVSESGFSDEGPWAAMSYAGSLCALDRDGAVACFLDDDWSDWRPWSPADLPTDSGFTRLLNTGDWACAWAEDRPATCWGRTLPEALPDSFDLLAEHDRSFCTTRAGATTCDLVGDLWELPMDGAEELELESGAVCGRSGEDIGCWNPNTGDALEEVPELESWSEISLSYTITASLGCGAVADGGLRCWGDAPSGLPSEGAWSQVTAGSTSDAYGVWAEVYVCALDEDHYLSCFGDPPDTLIPDEPLLDYMVRDGRTCALTVTGALQCWGTGPLRRQEPQ